MRTLEQRICRERTLRDLFAGAGIPVAMTVGVAIGAAITQSLQPAIPGLLEGCTLSQRAQVRLASAEYVIEGSHPVEALQRALAEHCK